MRRLAAILVLVALALVASAAAAPNSANQAALDRTVRYLQEAQQDDGGFGVAGEPSQITSAWTALALAAAGINPQDQRRPGGVDAFTYLAAHYQQEIGEAECAPVACTTTFERELMVVNASAADPHAFAGVDLVAGLLARARPDGSFPHVPGGLPGVNDTIFAIFALAPIGEAPAQAAIQPAADWIEAAQHENGGWAWGTSGVPDEVDMTGAAIQALAAAGRSGNQAVREGIAYLRKAQNPEGGFPAFPGDPESNVASTAWAVQAIWAVGENPEDWRTGSGLATEEPLTYMESLQAPDGHIIWKRSADTNGVWMTAYTTPAFAGHPWPIPAAPRSQALSAPPQPGEGEGAQSGSGVIAGGGGNGAPLFSRPKPQSKGRTPGGARVIHNKGARPTNHSRSRRGDNTEQPSGTESAEPASSDSPSLQSEAVGAGGGGAGMGSGSQSGGSFRAPKASGGQAAGREVSGVVVGSGSGGLAFGAPGLHGAGSGGDSQSIAIAIGAAALLLALLGARIERRQELTA
jgi:prenyltransferase beta subunit